MILRNGENYLDIWHSTMRSTLFLSLGGIYQLLNSFMKLVKEIKWIWGLWTTSWRWAMKKVSTLLEEFNRRMHYRLYVILPLSTLLGINKVSVSALCPEFCNTGTQGQRKDRMAKSQIKTFHKERTTYFFSPLEEEPALWWIDPEVTGLNHSKAGSCWMLRSSPVGKIKYWNRLPGEL